MADEEEQREETNHEEEEAEKGDDDDDEEEEGVPSMKKPGHGHKTVLDEVMEGTRSEKGLALSEKLALRKMRNSKAKEEGSSP